MILHMPAAMWPLRVFATRIRRRPQAAAAPDSSPRLRRVAPGDAAALTALLLGLSARSCRLRYSRAALDGAGAAAEARRLLAAPLAGGVVIVAVAPVAGGEQIVGVGELARCGADAELAVIVADQRQHEGIGKRLVAALQAAAQAEGIAQIRVDTLEENHAMCALARQLGLSLRERHEHGEVHFTALL